MIQKLAQNLATEYDRDMINDEPWPEDMYLDPMEWAERPVTLDPWEDVFFLVALESEPF